MKVNVLKGQEHGNCRALQPRYLEMTDPDHLTFSLAAENGKGLINTQTLALLASQAKPWYRTDQNGSITFRSPGTPGGGYTVAVNRGTANMSGPHDAVSTSSRCRWELGPAAPSALTATAVSTSRIDLEWTDNSADETGFRIERRTSGGSFAEIATVGAGVTAYGSTGLAAGTTYEYRVRAYNAAGSSAYSNTAGATTESPPPVAPAAPSALTATAVSTSRIDLGVDGQLGGRDGVPDRAAERRRELRGDRDGRGRRDGVRQHGPRGGYDLRVPGAGLQRGRFERVQQHGGRDDGEPAAGGARRAERPHRDGRLDLADRSGVDGQLGGRDGVPDRAAERRRELRGDRDGRGRRDVVRKHGPRGGHDLRVPGAGLQRGRFERVQQHGGRDDGEPAAGCARRAERPHGDGGLDLADRSGVDGQLGGRDGVPDRAAERAAGASRRSRRSGPA
jgi:hypothetical protein